jgi:hypothetical protein
MVGISFLFRRLFVHRYGCFRLHWIAESSPSRESDPSWDRGDFTSDSEEFEILAGRRWSYSALQKSVDEYASIYCRITASFWRICVIGPSHFGRSLDRDADRAYRFREPRSDME